MIGEFDSFRYLLIRVMQKQILVLLKMGKLSEILAIRNDINLEENLRRINNAVCQLDGKVGRRFYRRNI